MILAVSVYRKETGETGKGNGISETYVFFVIDILS